MATMVRGAPVTRLAAMPNSTGSRPEELGWYATMIGAWSLVVMARRKHLPRPPASPLEGEMQQTASVSTTHPTHSPLSALDRAPVWLNSEPLTAAALRGRVALVQFWTYSCINWL